jgi:allophanate hydrolase
VTDVHGSLELRSLRSRFAADTRAPEQLLCALHRKIAESSSGIWIHRESLDGLLDALRAAQERAARGDAVPLLGVPFGVKDNIDVAGVPTTAACPAFSYVPTESAPVVERLRSAGAICVGKTNMDQFATGLVGVRSPYGVCENAFDPAFISGGSSSGSGVAVALGLVTFALGTDTAGSGRVPAAFNNVVGVKPTRGRLSTRGVVPACRTLDCVSVFAGSCHDAAAILDVAGAFDPSDPYSERAPDRAPSWSRSRPRIGVLRDDQREFFGDREAARIYSEAVERCTGLGAVHAVDFTPFRRAAELLYGAPWVAERLHAAGELLAKSPEALDPVVRKILESARSFDALATFRGQYRLAELRRSAESAWADVDVLLLPTTPTTYRIAEIEAEPVELNRRLGYYTNFVNLMDLAAVAVPAGFRTDGLPLGVSFIGKAWSERRLLSLASRFHASNPAPTVGATRRPLSPPVVLDDAPLDGDMLLAVVGAHLSGQPLNHQLMSRGAVLVRSGRTAPQYRLFALSGTVPPKPGLLYDGEYSGQGIEIEVWSMGAAEFGSFVNEVPAPLAIGTLLLDDGTSVNGFVCEPHAIAGATEITKYGGWRAYRDSVRSEN